MIEAVIDTNLIIDVEEKREHYATVLHIIELHKSGALKVNIPTIMASEKYVDGKVVNNYKLFKQYIEGLGFTGMDHLFPPGFYDLTYHDCCIYDDDTMILPLREIHTMLFQEKKIEFEYKDYCYSRGLDRKAETAKEWKNALIDSLMLWSAFYYHKQMLITRDQNFQDHSSDIKSKYAVEIKHPTVFLPK